MVEQPDRGPGDWPRPAWASVRECQPPQRVVLLSLVMRLRLLMLSGIGVLVLASGAASIRAASAGSPMDDLHALTTSARVGQAVILRTERDPMEIRRYRMFVVRLPLAQQFGREHAVPTTVVKRWLRRGQLVSIKLDKGTDGRWRFRCATTESGALCLRDAVQQLRRLHGDVVAEPRHQANVHSGATAACSSLILRR